MKVSALSFGSWVTGKSAQLPREEPIEYLPDQNSWRTSRTRHYIVEAWNNGVNYVDAAEVYAAGEYEKSSVPLFETSVSNSPTLLLSQTLLGGPGPNDTGLSKKLLFEGMRASLERLDLDYADVVMAHCPDPLTPMEEIVRAFMQIVN